MDIPGFRRKATASAAAGRPKIVVWHDDEPRWLTQRTLRRLREFELPAVSGPLAGLADAVSGNGVVWLVRSGALPADASLFRLARPSPEILIGPPLDTAGRPAGGWLEVFERHAGRLDGVAARSLPPPAIVAVGAPGALRAHFDGSAGLMAAILGCAGTHRLVPASGLGAPHDPRPRLAVCISSLHVGGAERVAADLARLLPAEQVAARLFVLDRPQREALEPGPHAFLAYDGAAAGAAGAVRIARLRQALRAWGADALSLHLLSSNALQALGPLDRPNLLTLHNDRAGWPTGYDETARRMHLTIGCAIGVSRQASAAGLYPVRTAWNGVDAPCPPAGDGSQPLTRQGLGIPADALVVLCVANERPQKRLDRVAPVIDCLRRLGIDAHAIIAGHQATDGSAAASAVVHRVGPVGDVAALMRLADVYLSTSAHEGLSLSQIEAARAGLPVVATRTNGADEMAYAFASCRFVDPEADAPTFADAIRTVRETTTVPPAGTSDDLSARAMARRYANLTRGVLARGADGGDGVLFVCNDFAVGGAQASLARLMDELRRRGVRCAAFLVGETLERPSPGSQHLRQAGHAIEAVPRAVQRDLRALADRACAAADRGRYAGIVFWNAITEMKVRIADLAIGRRIVDVSPGEMYFRSLHRYFAAPARALPYLGPADYGAVLDGVVVKYAREAEVAAEALGRPVHVIPNGVPTRPMAAGSQGGRVRIGTLCRISPDKKLEQILDAVRHLGPRHESFELLIGGAPDVGHDAYAAGLRRAAADLPVRWLGQVAADEFLPGLDAFALVAEPAGCPNASLEAMAHGLAVVATDAGGMNEQVVDGVTGRLVARGDAQGLADALATLIDAPALRAAMGCAGRARAQTEFSLARMADRYMHVLGVAAGRA